MVVFVEHVALGRGFRFCSIHSLRGDWPSMLIRASHRGALGFSLAGGADLAWLEITREHVFVVIPHALVRRWLAVASHSCSPS